MSLVYITRHYENIAAIEKHLFAEPLRAARSSTKFKRQIKADPHKTHLVPLGDGKVLVTNSTKHKHGTMGHAEIPLRSPCQFLRKHEGLRWYRERQHECTRELTIEPVPRFQRTNTPPKPRKVPNFISVNIMKSKSAPATRYAPRYVDTVRGDTHNLLDTGLVPQYRCRPNYGKVPCYLRCHKQYLAQARRTCHEQQMRVCTPLMDSNHIRPMTAEERHTILSGLKTNHAKVLKAFQKMTVHIDNVGLKVRKGAFENELRQLEQDIFLLEHNPVIYVSKY